MKKFQAILTFAAIVLLGLSVAGMAEGIEGKTISFNGEDTTTPKRAVFAATVRNDLLGDDTLDTNFTVSNVCATKTELEDFMGDRQDHGTVAIFLWDQDGTAYVFDTLVEGDSVGNGLDENGELGPGETWLFQIEEILQVVTGQERWPFDGYAWVCSTFDCLAGTYSVTLFTSEGGLEISFSQAYELLPGMGQGAPYFGGIPLP